MKALRVVYSGFQMNLKMLGTSSFWEAATPARDAACGGAALNRMAFTPAFLNAATWPVMSWSAGVIFCSWAPAEKAMAKRIKRKNGFFTMDRRFDPC